jgi:amidase
MLRPLSDKPLFAENLKFALYRSAAADLLAENLTKTQEPWPQGYEMLENIHKETDANLIGRATVSALWKAQYKRTEFSKRMLESWAATKTATGTGREMDALLMPCSPWPASSR